MFKVDILQAMAWTVLILKNDISPTCICNCFKRTQLLTLNQFINDETEMDGEREEEHDRNEEIEETISSAITCIYGSNIINSDDINYNFESDIQENEPEEVDNINTNEECTYVATDRIPWSVQRDHWLNTLKYMLPMDHPVDYEIKKAIKKKLATVDSEILANATQTNLNSYFSSE